MRCYAQQVAARGIHALVDGSIQNWRPDQKAFDLADVRQCAVNVDLKGLEFSVAPE